MIRVPHEPPSSACAYRGLLESLRRSSASVRYRQGRGRRTRAPGYGMPVCPICRGCDVEDDTCARCGSLEGLQLPEAASTAAAAGRQSATGVQHTTAGGHSSAYARLLQKGSGRTFGFDWANGFVSPYRPSPGAQLEAALSAVHSRLPGGLGPDKLLVDLGCG